MLARGLLYFFWLSSDGNFRRGSFGNGLGLKGNGLTGLLNGLEMGMGLGKARVLLSRSNQKEFEPKFALL